MEDKLILFELLLQGDEQKEPSLHFNLVSLNMKPNAESTTVVGRKWLENIHIFENIWSINLNAQSINKFEKYESG